MKLEDITIAWSNMAELRVNISFISINVNKVVSFSKKNTDC